MPVIQFGDGILVDIEALPGQTFATQGNRGVPDIEKRFEDSMDQLGKILKTLTKSADDVILNGKATEVEFTFSVSFNAEGNCVFAKLGTSTSVQVKTKFVRDPVRHAAPGATSSVVPPAGGVVVPAGGVVPPVGGV